MVFQAFETPGGLFHAACEHLEGRFNARLEGYELPHVGCKVHVILLEVAFAASNASDDLLHMGEVFVEFIAAFCYLDEPLVGLVHFREGVQHCVCHVVKEARGVRACGSLTSVACTTSVRPQPHLRVPITCFKEEY